MNHKYKSLILCALNYSGRIITEANQAKTEKLHPVLIRLCPSNFRHQTFSSPDYTYPPRPVLTDRQTHDVSSKSPKGR